MFEVKIEYKRSQNILIFLKTLVLGIEDFFIIINKLDKDIFFY